MTIHYKLSYTFAVNNAETLKAIKTVSATLAGGYTITTNQGGWVDDNGALIEEKSYTLTALLDTTKKVHDIEVYPIDITYPILALLHKDGQQTTVYEKTRYSDILTDTPFSTSAVITKNSRRKYDRGVKRALEFELTSIYNLLGVRPGMFKD